MTPRSKPVRAQHRSHTTFTPAGGRARSGWFSRFIGHILHDPARAVAMSLLLTALASVVINALYLQPVRHPAPVFEVPANAMPQDTQSEPAPAQVPVPVARSSAFSTAMPPIDDAALPATGFSEPPSTPSAVTAAATAVQKPDQIGDLITNSTAKPPAPSPTVLNAQRALAKLGYSVRPDGINGGSTRQAVERFERDNRLPVKGDLTPKIRRELSIATGIVIE